MKKNKEKKNIKNRKLKQKINNDHFLLRFYNTALDVIFVQLIFSVLGAFSYNVENKGKYCPSLVSDFKLFRKNDDLLSSRHKQIFEVQNPVHEYTRMRIPDKIYRTNTARTF